jgi:hypothetical protein
MIWHSDLDHSLSPASTLAILTVNVSNGMLADHAIVVQDPVARDFMR